MEHLKKWCEWCESNLYSLGAFALFAVVGETIQIIEDVMEGRLLVLAIHVLFHSTITIPAAYAVYKHCKGRAGNNKE